MNNDPFHQTVSVIVEFGEPYKPGEINRILKSLGATLHYDVYSFERPDKGPIWQSESYIYATLFSHGEEVDAQEVSDCIELKYPLATIGTEFIPKFADTVEQVSSKFDARPLLNGAPTDRGALISYCDDLVTNLMQEWGEEPGSETLRMLIENNF